MPAPRAKRAKRDARTFRTTDVPVPVAIAKKDGVHTCDCDEWNICTECKPCACGEFEYCLECYTCGNGGMCDDEHCAACKRCAMCSLFGRVAGVPLGKLTPLEVVSAMRAELRSATGAVANDRRVVRLVAAFDALEADLQEKITNYPGFFAGFEWRLNDDDMSCALAHISDVSVHALDAQDAWVEFADHH